MCLGNPYYGRLAFNLAVTIKQVEPTMPITIVWEGKALSLLRNYDLNKTFDHIIEAPKEAYTTNGKQSYFKAKLYAYELSPFDETIYIDCDMVWLIKKPSELFESLKEFEFSAISEGFYDMATGENKINKAYQVWAKIEDIKAAYNLSIGKLYQMRSEFIYFKKSEANKAFFDKAIEIYDSPKMTFIAVGGVQPDELAFNIAGALCQHYPHAEKYCPIYWYFLYTREWNDKAAMYNKYYAMSMGGNTTPSYVKEFYNRLVKARFNKSGTMYPFIFQDKRSWLPERKSF